MEQITTITFFRFPNPAARWWGFRMMQFAHERIAKAGGLTFYKLMGSGRSGGFNPLPDWSVYCLLQVWEDEASAETFLRESEIMTEYRDRCSEVWTVFLRTITSHGEWSGGNPFTVSTALDSTISQIAVVTRATIKPRFLIPFWRYVPTSRRRLRSNPGLLYSKGIGEIPIIQMATFSMWQDKEALRTFAYGSAEHRKAIEKTRKLDWYKEELFARFQPYRTEGSWGEIKTGTILSDHAGLKP